MSAERLRVTYRLPARASESEARARAEALANEQTVEVPPAAVRDAFVQGEILGRVEDLCRDDDGGWLATLAYPARTTGFDPAQFVNVLFGNASLLPDVECVDAELPESLLAALQGPRFGIAGLRKAVGAYDRPLTCTAVKPMGLPPAALAALLGEFARAGIDVVKDDHGLADQDFCPFEDRVRACLEAGRRAADETGHSTVYAPNLSGPPERVFAQLRFAEDHGARAVLASPMLIGLPVFWELCQRRASVPVLAHPAFGGAARLAPALLFGRLFRLLGADAVIFVSFGGRFAQDRATCQHIADALRSPWGPLRPALPVPGGGIELENADEAVRFYGSDAMLLVGGSLQVGDGSLFERAREFVRCVRGAALRGAG